MSRSLLACALLLLAATLAPAQECPTLSLVEPVGTGTAGSAGVPQLVLVGQAGVDEPWPALRVEHGPPHGLGQIAVGAPGVVVPLPQYGASLYVGGAFTRWVVPLDAEGRSAPLGGGDGPVPASFCGLEFAAQGLTIDAGATGGCAFSAGLTLRFGAGSGATSLFDGFILSLVPSSLSSAMELGDLDGNGLLDVAAPTGGGNGRLVVFLQLADGGFFERSSAALGLFLRDLALGDLDGDGRLDAVAVGGTTTRKIVAAFGQPDGTLSAPTELATSTD
ncbi:MAG TPA: VCBS repeat-containing protein, partial [Planctomycetota bacterium]|nr:VCBS repeat-containing protein [Planctomycetota bacterium]